MLKIYNTLTKEKEVFVPRQAGKIGMYVCGMTVYDYCHVGHARVMVVFDVVARYLRASGYAVTYVRNITDIDDKIIKRAHENGEEMATLTARFIAAMHEDAAALAVLPPDDEPRATASMEAIVEMILSLKERGYAYQADNGDVYYDVSRFAHYGALSGKRVEDLRAGERVAVDEAKDDPLDFVLWKAAKPGEPSWDAPFGPGRPGWHIECSAMSTHCLGEHFDIHGGGMDLMFPHHENEIAQSASGHKFVNYWMHNGFVQINEEKMSKSLGNFFTVREVLKQYRPEVVRYFILSSHYRSPLNYSQENLDSAKAALHRFYTALRDVPVVEGGDIAADDSDYEARFRAAMDDDFNTPEAMAVLFDLARDVNRAKSEGNQEEASRLAGILKNFGAVLGLLQDNPREWLRGGGTTIHAQSAHLEITTHPATVTVTLGDEKIQELIQKRLAARKAKNWAESDRIRDELKAQGIILEDRPDGITDWRRA
ncbi:MAG: cysteine--tRNA ligase [Gammaproteobacteria bacterium]